MARKLEDIFNECYERIRAGESLQSCLARYPEHRTELKSLLETTFDIGRRASYIHPRPEFKHWAQVRLQGAQHYHANQQRQVETPSRFGWLRQSWAMAATAVLILLLTTGSTMAASSNAMPDQTLYPIKLATEEMRLAFAVTDTQKAQIHTQLAETRAAEVEAMANEGKTEHAAITAARLAKQLEQANSAIAKLESAAGTAPSPTPAPEPTQIKPLPPTPPEEAPIVQPTVTEEQPTTTVEQPSTTEGQQTPTEATSAVPPTLTDNKTTPAVPPTPPEDTTQEKTQTDKTDRFKKSLNKSTSKSLWALENAKDKASQQSKADWQRSIDTISKKSYRTGQSDNTTGQGGTSDNASPNQSQQSPRDWRHR